MRHCVGCYLRGAGLESVCSEFAWSYRGTRDNRRVNAAITVSSIEDIEAHIAPLRERLTAHPLYGAMCTKEHLRLFMESHVYAVWDFMCLLKSLQQKLTCVGVFWVPTEFPASRRFINEIVLGEESDEFDGRPVSHFEVYLEAMQECGADTSAARKLIETARLGQLDLTHVPDAAAKFVGNTFEVIRKGSLAAQAAAFTFGREDVIPDMFRELVRELNRENSGELSKFVWYLERHIEVDGEDHGPLSLKMVSDLCGDDAGLWEEAAVAAEMAIEARLVLWDGILEQMQKR
jgi:hypothetical protein